MLKVIQFKYGKFQKTLKTDFHEKYKRAKLDLQAEERAQKVAMKVRCRENYFEDIHTQNFERQLGGTLTNLEVNNTEFSISRNYVFPERERIAKMFFFFSKPVYEEDLMARRHDIVSDLIALCFQREIPDKNIRKSRLSKTKPDCKKNDVKMIVNPIELKISTTQCIFCLGDNHLSYEDRTRQFSRADSLRRHVDDVHLSRFNVNNGCPHPACDAVFETVMQFKNHAGIVHSIKLSFLSSTCHEST